uniref:Uncharacterized protein n=1 Tax=Chromera velia CCMP2878 TaxID=1169474 RepID=A0A0G4G6I8_9ALVE|eukprot:Cvel_4234.t1-p1 / transcript=Cvel_4234.t1 / gene=Cvel_4234 / organism=Chromera_velia_CCMP2878 / gene_product=hypothetical protein / transcript_product=hypothetical protein / location=Cvel_scaffold183:39196-39528(-) / protein_length=111 / sequence_SO=supercontig / SO=protein_coding / is_pseudo=false
MGGYAITQLPEPSCGHHKIPLHRSGRGEGEGTNRKKEQAVRMGKKGRGDRRGTRASGEMTGRRTTENCGEKQTRGSPLPDLQMPQPKQQPPYAKHGGRYSTQTTRPASASY